MFCSMSEKIRKEKQFARISAFRIGTRPKYASRTKFKIDEIREHDPLSSIRLSERIKCSFVFVVTREKRVSFLQARSTSRSRELV